MILHVHRPLTESLDLIEIANSFVNCEHRLTVFDKFCSIDLIENFLFTYIVAIPRIVQNRTN